METVVALIDEVLMNISSERKIKKIGEKVADFMGDRPLFKQRRAAAK